MRLKNKLFISFLVFIVVPLGTFSFLNYDTFSKVLLNKAFFTMDKSFDQSYSYLSEKMNKVTRISEIAIQNEDTVSLVAAEKAELSEIDKMLFVAKIMNTMDTLQDEDIYEVQLYLRETNPYRVKGYFFPVFEAIRSVDWYPRMVSANGRMVWLTAEDAASTDFHNNDIPGEKLFSLARIIGDPNSLSRPVGLLRVHFKAGKTEEIIRNAAPVKGALTYIRNSVGDPVAISDAALYEQLGHSDSPNGCAVSDTDFAEVIMEGNKVYYKGRQLPHSDWCLVSAVPYESIISETVIIRNSVFALIAVIVALAFGAAWIVALSLTKRISVLTKKMREARYGKLSKVQLSSEQDEIGKLGADYNFMVEQISGLIQERYRAGIEVKQAELRALQAQINPHFLYNSLDMINWLAHGNKPELVEKAVNSLAMFYKLSLSKGKDVVSIQDEIEHVSYYVSIQNMRFQDRIEFIAEVPDAVARMDIPKLTLQPLVENAIIHGIMQKPSRTGTVMVKAEMEGGEIVLSVLDDGIGIAADKLKQLRQSKVDDPGGSGYGIWNIINRIKLAYGEQYGMNIQSEDHGTIVQIRFPGKEEREQA